jgi:drug/metabolite transporter (DMT)-like permease
MTNKIERKAHLDGIAISLLLACCLFWGAQQVLVKATLAEIAPLFQVGIRFIGATALLYGWCRWRNIELWQQDASLRPGLIAGALFAAEFACIYIGLQFTSASRLTIFLYTSPFWVALFVPMWVKSEKMGSLQWAGLLLAFCGVAFAMYDGLSSAVKGHWVGDVLGLAAGLLWGLTTVVIRTTKLSKLSAEKILFYQIAVSGVVLMMCSWAMGENWVIPNSTFAISSMVIQTVLGAFLSYLVWMWLLGHYPATRISGFVFLTPLCTLLVGSWWLREPVTLPLIFGLTFVAAGMLLVNKRN